MGYVTGVGGSAQSVREYLATPDRDKYRYLADNPIQCQVSDEGRASGCTGITNLRHEKVSVYDDSDSATMAVVARVELDQGDIPGDYRGAKAGCAMRRLNARSASRCGKGMVQCVAVILATGNDGQPRRP